jgi:hypothetical protein
LSIQYCHQDVYILQETFKKLLFELHKISTNLKLSTIYSTAGLSATIFKQLYNNKNIKTNNHIFDNEIRSGYFGGRCEVFGNATTFEKVYYFDFESMYPTSMLGDFPLDIGILKHYENIPTSFTFGVYNISFSSDMHIPILPIN